MEYLFFYVMILIFFAFLFFFLMLPIFIAEKRQIEKSKITIIKILSFFSLLFGITWLIALVLSLTYKSKNIIENNDLDRLEKLANLKERGILTQEEFEKEKNKLLDK